jgi:hypothetical protein
MSAVREQSRRRVVPDSLSNCLERWGGRCTSLLEVGLGIAVARPTLSGGEEVLRQLIGCRSARLLVAPGHACLSFAPWGADPEAVAEEVWARGMAWMERAGVVAPTVFPLTSLHDDRLPPSEVGQVFHLVGDLYAIGEVEGRLDPRVMRARGREADAIRALDEAYGAAGGGSGTEHRNRRYWAYQQAAAQRRAAVVSAERRVRRRLADLHLHSRVVGL